MLNRVILMCRLVSDPELKTTSSGISVTSFRIAVDRSYVKAGTERQTDFFDIVCWRSTAEFVCRYFFKGSLIALEGQLQSRTYQAKDGSNRYVVEVVADNVSFTGERREGGGYSQGGYSQGGYSQGGYSQPYDAAPQRGYSAPAEPAAPSYSNGSVGDFEEMPLDDDLPF